MIPPDVDKGITSAMLREVAHASGSIIDSLLGAGFTDVQEDDLVIISAVARGARPEVIASLIHDQVIGDQALTRASGELISQGYLEVQDNPGMPGRKKLALAERGAVVSDLIEEAVRLDRWKDFPFRQDDIIISALPKSGTTWMQMICAVLIFQTPEIPAPLQELSPWIDRGGRARDEIFGLLATQQHRRFVKSHLLPGEIPIDSRAKYIVVARHPLDTAASFYRLWLRIHGDSGTPDQSVPDPREALLWFIDSDAETVGLSELPSLSSALRRLSSVWERGDPNVVFFHYEDLLEDLEGQMRRLAERLGIAVPETRWPDLVKAATFEQMRAAADRLQPIELLENQPQLFFHSGRAGSGRELLTGTDLDHYHERAAQLATPDLLDWLHR
jgi:aryl sulfotransferase